MTMTDEIKRLRRKAAELVEQAARRGRPLSPAEDAEILVWLKRARELGIRAKEDKKTHQPAN